MRVAARYIFLCIGFASKINWPDIPNREAFKGDLYHSGTWPEGLEPEHLSGKNIAIVGSGASGVQITQELGRVAKDLTVLVRTPNLTLPMHNPKVTASEQELFKDGYDAIFEKRDHTFAGFHYDFDYQPWERHSPEERQRFYEMIWSRLGFHFWLEWVHRRVGPESQKASLPSLLADGLNWIFFSGPMWTATSRRSVTTRCMRSGTYIREALVPHVYRGCPSNQKHAF